MSIAHLNQLKKVLENNHWIIQQEHEFSWLISRPNGDSEIELLFPEWYGAMGELRETTIEKSITCEVAQNTDIDLYFGKFSKSFQTDVEDFVTKLNRLEKEKKERA